MAVTGLNASVPSGLTTTRQRCTNELSVSRLLPETYTLRLQSIATLVVFCYFSYYTLVLYVILWLYQCQRAVIFLLGTEIISWVSICQVFEGS
jgi:hypothetical protein